MINFKHFNIHIAKWMETISFLHYSTTSSYEPSIYDRAEKWTDSVDITIVSRLLNALLPRRYAHFPFNLPARIRDIVLDHRLAFHTVLLSGYLLLKTTVNSVVMYRKGVCCMFSMHSHQQTEDHEPVGIDTVDRWGSLSRGILIPWGGICQWVLCWWKWYIDGSCASYTLPKQTPYELRLYKLWILILIFTWLRELFCLRRLCSKPGWNLTRVGWSVGGPHEGDMSKYSTRASS